jgi:hypothetical protein
MNIIRILKWPILIIGALIVVAFFHYFLPSKDVVRIVGVDVKRMDVTSRELVTEGDGVVAQKTRDVRFINGIWPSGKPRVYRNEDTGWGFPWYFKFDSGNLQAEAQDAAISQSAGQRWYVVTHYGWRIEILSMFPNAVSLRTAPGPDYSPVPWFNIVFLLFLALLFITIWWFVLKLRQRHVDPVLDDIQENIDEAMASAADATQDVRSGLNGLYDRWQRWLDTWRSKDKRRG